MESQPNRLPGDLSEALRALKCRHEEVLAIQEGIDDMEAGRVMPLREFDTQFRQRKGLPTSFNQ